MRRREWKEWADLELGRENMKRKELVRCSEKLRHLFNLLLPPSLSFRTMIIVIAYVGLR